MDLPKKEDLIAAIQAYLDSMDYQEIHCTSCGRWLGNEKILIGMSQVRCRKCKLYTSVSKIGLDTFFEIIKDFS